MPKDSIAKVFDTSHNTIEGFAAHEDLRKIGYFYCSLVGELMYSYITCQSNTGYSIFLPQ